MVNVEVIICYIVALILFGLYLYNKYRYRKYIFSPFNIWMVIYSFVLFVVPFFCFDSKAWIALNITDANSMVLWLNRSMLINSTGFMIYIISLMFFEFGEYKSKYLNNLLFKLNNEDEYKIIDKVFKVSILFWYLIVIIYNHGLPLINNGRTFFLGLPISPIYLLINQWLVFFGLYYGYKYLKNKTKLTYVFVSVLTLFFTGNRGPLLVDVLMPIIIIYIYFHEINDKNNQINYNIYPWRDATFKILLCSFVILVIGLGIQTLRVKVAINYDVIIRLLFYGNTFADIRDGAFILNGFEKVFNDKLLYGKTYIAGLISFIPSFLSDFRTEWSYGKFVTNGLFGWKNHFGLRGGQAMESYINFGWLGVIIFSILLGFISASLERIFYKRFLLRKGGQSVNAQEWIVFLLILSIQSSLICSSAMATFYAYVFLVLTLFITSKYSNKAL